MLVSWPEDGSHSEWHHCLYFMQQQPLEAFQKRKMWRWEGLCFSHSFTFYRNSLFHFPCWIIRNKILIIQNKKVTFGLEGGRSVCSRPKIYSRRMQLPSPPPPTYIEINAFLKYHSNECGLTLLLMEGKFDSSFIPQPSLCVYQSHSPLAWAVGSLLVCTIYV